MEEVTLPDERGPVRSNTHVLNSVGMVVNPIASNPTLQNAMQVLDQLSDIGRVLPFVAPAFMLLKIIIDVEKKAQEVDTKCNDLLERITFMLSHMPVLKRIEVNSATRQVILRMNDSLKDAAALITAYRKQGFVARRLNISSREKFMACAESLNVCCKDLMMSLQIHQTDKLNILTREVPVDGEDEEAHTFVEAHGSIENVSHSRELVEEFAKQQQLNVDDTVMEQLRTGLNDTIQRNQIRLEEVLSSNLDAAVIYGLKGLAAEMNAIEAEQRFSCVQCGKEFRQTTNAPKACSFHRGEYDSWSKSYPCCGTANPCEYRSHRENHHCDYPYGNFFEYSRGILNYVDTVDQWTSVEDVNLETDAIEKASIGKLLRWKSRGAVLDEPIILITVGRVWYRYPYFFDTFTSRELQSVAAALSLTGDTMIYRTSSSDLEYAMAEWILSLTGDIIGVRLTAKTATSPTPYIHVCHFDISNCSPTGEVIVISEGGLRAYKPSSPYTLPSTVRFGPELNEKSIRAARTDFRSQASAKFPVLLRCSSVPPLSANTQWVSEEKDFFHGIITVFNDQRSGSNDAVTIISASAFYRLVGDDEYLPVAACAIEEPQLPVSIEARQSCRFKFSVTVPRSKEDIALARRWWNRAFVARKRPIRIKLILESIYGQKCSLVMEYVYEPFKLTNSGENDLGFFFFDNPHTMSRAHIAVQKVDGGSGFIKFDHQEVSEMTLVKLVYNAIKTKNTECDLGIGQEKNDGEWEWAAYALIDLSCRRVYAFKVILKEGSKVGKKQFGCIGYVLCPEYGRVIDHFRTPRYATEKVKLPDLQPYLTESFVSDDTKDDYIPEVIVPGPSTDAVQDAVPFTIPEELNSRLKSIDSNLSRIAIALELIAEKIGSS